MNQHKFENQPQLNGWQLATTTSGEHLKHIVKMYQELGIEIQLIRIEPLQCGECTECYTAGNEPIYQIYIKQRNNR